MNNIESYYQYSRPEVLEFLPKEYSKVLEIGCAEGDFRRNLDQNCEYWGIEPISSIAKNAKDHLYKVLNGTFEEVYDQLPNNYFDLVICNDVIEHMPDHDAFLQTIKRKLTKHGYIVGSIPNVRYVKNLIEVLFEKDWRYKEHGILDKTHLRFFTEKSLRRTFGINEYSIEQLSGINCVLGNIFTIDGSYRRIKYFPLMLFFGQDIKFMQFGFRINPNKKQDNIANQL